MLQAAHSSLASTSYSALFHSATDNLSPAKIRQSIADLVAQNRLPEADRLSLVALEHLPESEDILIMRALVTQVRQDWPAADAALEKLLTLQGPKAQAVTWVQWVRVQRCKGQLHRAFNTAMQALKHHPAHPAITTELAELELMGLGEQSKAA